MKLLLLAPMAALLAGCAAPADTSGHSALAQCSTASNGFVLCRLEDGDSGRRAVVAWWPDGSVQAATRDPTGRTALLMPEKPTADGAEGAAK